MGCDIHVLVQRKDNDHWLTIEPDPSVLDKDGNPIYEYRSYETFGMLAGVRGDTLPPISEPKGIPDDLRERTTVITSLTWGDTTINVDGKYLGDHSFSWLTLAEIEAYGPPDDTTIAELLVWMRTLGFPEDVRIVFGFDN